ncbi:MAG: PAS domain S-box protein [Deltaproteobacteria bacterium]|nr:PAS domain S-box protein [Deltaproteobacteria bacterium]MCB9785705.1 PAS domain S-box protein [Deltaproteobacteria bacterium]
MVRSVGEAGTAASVLVDIDVVMDLYEGLFVVLDREGRVQACNARMAELLGRLPSDARGVDWFESIIAPEDRVEARAHFDAVLNCAVAGALPFERSIQTRAGGPRRVRWRCGVHRGAEGAVTRVLCSGMDVTEMVEARSALAQAERYREDMTTALDASSIVAATDQRGIIKYANDTFCEISGYSREELLGQDHAILNSGYHSKAFIRDLWRTIAQGRVWRGDIRNRRKDGRLYWVDTTIVPFLDERGKPYQYLSIRSDITERKAAEAKLRDQAALARLGEMSAVVAHEVKNPLAGISGALQVIGSRMPADARERKVLDDIDKRIRSLDASLSDLLTFARPRALKVGDVDVLELVRATADLVQQDQSVTHPSFTVEGEPVTASVDAMLLREAVLNLLLNASQAMDGQGEVRVMVETRGDDVVLTVADQGPGIPEAHREKVFEPFFTTRTRGTGLGLANVRRTFEAHGGSIDFACPATGGTHMICRLPRGEGGRDES